MKTLPRLLRREGEDHPRPAFLREYQEAILWALERRGKLRPDQREACRRRLGKP